MLEPYLERLTAFQTARVLFDWDESTIEPPMSNSLTSKVVGTLAMEEYQILSDSTYQELVMELKDNKELSLKEATVVKELAKDIERTSKIPAEEYKEFTILVSQAGSIWAKAKNNNDYASFAPTLGKLIAFQKKFAGYRRKTGQDLYDVLLGDFEEAFDKKALDAFFARLKEEIVPLLKEVSKKNDEIDTGFLTLSYDTKKQDSFNRELARYLGFDFEKGVIAESEHPFTTNLHNRDVRITTHYYENQLDSAMFSTIHETGHALYEMNIADELTQTPAGGGASAAMHESQSRFYENIIGRSKAFWEPLYGKLQETFPEQLGNVSLDTYIRAINKAQASLIRTESDELTYCLHIMVRYELEKLMIESDVDVMELPKLWADKYEEYLGVRPKTDTEGILQDIHWSFGEFGYFPSYALGNAFASQIYAQMEKEMDVEAILRSGDISPIQKYLAEHIHQYGMTKNSRELILDVCGEDFTPDYYVEYLKDKYKRIYEL